MLKLSKASHLIAGVFLLAALPAQAQFTGPGAAIPAPIADLIVQNAKIKTPQGWATSLAVAKGAIIAIGDAAAVEPFRTASVPVIDAKGSTIVPGLYDMHVHPLGAGLNAQNCEIGQGASAAQALATIKACEAEKQPGAWLTGNGHDNASFGKTPPNKAMLDKISSDRPMLFFDISGHSSWANSAALKIAGIDRNTPNPEGGIIERDRKGEPTGVLRESASRMVWSKIPGATRQENRNALEWGLGKLLAYGVTSFDDAGLSEAGALAYSDLADDGRLKQRVRGCIMAADTGLMERRGFYQRDRFSPTCVKIFLDGVPTDGHTAAMVEPYAHAPHGTEHGGNDGRERGMLLIPAEQVNDMVTRFDGMGLTVKFHAAGDAAVRTGINAIAAARAAHGWSPQMHNVGHSSFVQMSDIERAKQAGATFEFSPFIWAPSPITVDIQRAIGEERMKRWIPVKDALESGAAAVPGSDWPVTPSANPWAAIETLVTRQAPGGVGEPLGADERITLEQAFDLFTSAAARSRGDFAFAGTLEVGKVADFLMLDRNIFEIPITSVHQTQVLQVFIDGESVHQAGAK